MGYPYVHMVSFQPLAGLKADESGSALTGTVTVTPGTAVLMKAPAAAAGGGLRIIEAFAHIKLGSAATLALVDMGAGGTSVASTICTFGTSWADVPVAGTPAGHFLDAGDYLGVKWSAGTITAGPNNITVAYVMGK